jgi:hypothetical protein
MTCFDYNIVNETIDPNSNATSFPTTILSNTTSQGSQNSDIDENGENQKSCMRGIDVSNDGMQCSELYDDAIINVAHIRDIYNESDVHVVESLVDATFILSDFFCEQALSPKSCTIDDNA